MKICSKCKQNKKYTEYNKNKSRKDGYQHHCRLCDNYNRRKWYASEDNSKHAIIYNTFKRKELKEWFVKYKSKLKCEECDENHPACLDFHHINSKEKDINISQAILNTWSIKRIENEINKCKILCSNCHRKLHWNNKGL